MRRKLLVGAGVAVASLALMTTTAFAQEVEEPLAAEAVQGILDNIWVLIAAVLVIFMQAGFALVEAGLTRAKSVANIMMKNMMDFCAGVLAFFTVGFALAFGEGNDFFGTSGWFLDTGTFTADYFGTLSLPTFFIFQVAFAATAATIVSGAMAERTKFKSYFVYSLVISAFIYPLVVHWTWGGGWISQLDFAGDGSVAYTDFAGSSIVHMVGGIAALMGAIALGPRIGKYGEDGKPRAIPGHSIPFAIVGVFILFIGWFGFNPGSELAADEAVSAIAVTTLLAGAMGGVAAMLTVWAVEKKPDVAMTGNGVLAGLVGITAGCAAVSNWGAIIIGAICGVVVVFAVFGIDRLKVDDPVGAVSVHGVCGALGTILVGFLATEGGLFYGDGAQLLLTQLVGVGAIAVWAAVTAGILFFVIKAIMGLRVPAEEEIEGLDTVEHGAPGYGPDLLTGAGMPGSATASELTLS